VVDVLEFKIASFVGQSGLLAVSGYADHLAVPDPGASGSERSDASGITSGSSIDAMMRPGWRTSGSAALFTLLAFLDFDGEYTFESLGPSERGPVSSRPSV
jgi:hypothetical protein